MDEINDNQHEVIDPLRLDRCPDCGYLLTGLPEAGQCPECGFAYSADQIVLYGWHWGVLGRHGNQTLRSRHLHLVFDVLMAGVSLYLLSLTVSRLWNSWLSLAVPLILLSQAAWRIWEHTRQSPSLSDSPAPIQVRLQPEGFAMRNNIGRVRLRPWRKDTLLEMRMAGNYHGRLRIGRRRLGLAVYLAAVEFKGNDAAVKEVQRHIEQWCPTVKLT